MTRPIVRVLRDARPEIERLGLIDFDAHIDAHVIGDEGSHNGTPIRGIIEDDNGVEARKIVQIGISGFVGAEFYRRYLVEEQGATIFSSREVPPQPTPCATSAVTHSWMTRCKAAAPPSWKTTKRKPTASARVPARSEQPHRRARLHAAARR